MRQPRPRPRDLRGGDDGFSLVELSVVIALIGTVGLVFLTGIVSGTKASKGVSDRTEAAAELQTAVERIARELRVADPVEAGTASAAGVQVRVYRGGACTRFAYRLVGSSLVEYRQTPLTPAPGPAGSPQVAGTCSTPAAVEPPSAALPQRTLVTGVASGTVFRYFDRDGVQLDFSAIPRPLESRIATVEVQLRHASAARGALEVSTRVSVRNSRG